VGGCSARPYSVSRLLQPYALPMCGAWGEAKVCGVVDFHGCCLCSAAAATIPMSSSMKEDVVAAAALRSLALTRLSERESERMELDAVAPDPLLAVDELRPPPPAAAEDVLLSSSDGQSPPPDAVALLLHSIVVRVVSLADLGLLCPQANAMRTPQERNFLVDAGH
jgi:hypothetical protein